MEIALIAAYDISANLYAFQLAKDIASPWLNTLMAAIGKSFIVVVPLILLYMLLKRDKNVYSFALAGVLLYLISDTIKMIVMEPRPCDTAVTNLTWINKIGCDASYSFPSNHASVLTGLPFFMGKYRILQALYVIWLLFVLFGRIYLGLHYFTDVVGGVVLSLAVAALVYSYRNRINGILDGVARVLHIRIGWREG